MFSYLFQSQLFTMNLKIGRHCIIGQCSPLRDEVISLTVL